MNLKVSFFSFLVLSILLLSSCDPCKKVECNHGGTCIEGTCACSAGYSGEFCETFSKDEVAGSYAVSETCTSGSTDSYSCSIQASTTSDLQVEFTNLYNLEGKYALSTLIYGDFTGENTITIASQTRQSTNGDVFVFSGTADVLENGNVVVSFNVEVNGDTDDCTATFTEQ